MDRLYSFHNAYPSLLPTRFTDPDGMVWTDLAGQLAEGHLSSKQISAWGFRQVDPAPDAESGHRVEWDGEDWVQTPLPPEPEPRPRDLGKLEFIELCQSAGGMTDAMLVEARDDTQFGAFWTKYQMASDVSRDHPATTDALQALAASGYLPAGADAVIDAWPTA